LLFLLPLPFLLPDFLGDTVATAVSVAQSFAHVVAVPGPVAVVAVPVPVAAVVLSLFSFAPQDIPHKYILQDAPKEELEIVFYLKP